MISMSVLGYRGMGPGISGNTNRTVDFLLGGNVSGNAEG